MPASLLGRRSANLSEIEGREKRQLQSPITGKKGDLGVLSIREVRRKNPWRTSRKSFLKAAYEAGWEGEKKKRKE